MSIMKFTADISSLKAEHAKAVDIQMDIQTLQKTQCLLLQIYFVLSF